VVSFSYSVRRLNTKPTAARLREPTQFSACQVNERGPVTWEVKGEPMSAATMDRVIVGEGEITTGGDTFGEALSDSASSAWADRSLWPSFKDRSGDSCAALPPPVSLISQWRSGSLSSQPLCYPWP